MAADDGRAEASTLRLVWPAWQGAGSSSVRDLAPELPFEEARRGYAVGTAVLQQILPVHRGPTAFVGVSLDDTGLAERDGIEAKDAVLGQLEEALRLIADRDAPRIVTLGGDCSVSVAPFAALAERYGDDLAVIWIDAHPDVGMPESAYHGYHAMAVSAILGHGDPEVLALLPATIAPERVALAGLHSWTDDDFPHIGEWGLSAFDPDSLRESSEPLLRWLEATGCSRVAVHLDVDVVDSDEEVFGLGIERGGLTSAQARRVVEDIAARADVVGLTIAEYIPRQVIRLRRLLSGLPLLEA